MTVAAEEALLEKVPTGLFVGGEWRSGSTGRTFDVEDPATGSVLARVADGTAEDAAAALDAAVEAAGSWARTDRKSVV